MSASIVIIRRVDAPESDLSGSLVGFSARGRSCRPSSLVRQTQFFGLSGIMAVRE